MIDPSLTYKIKGVQSEKCIYSNRDGRFSHYDCTDNQPDQNFKFESFGDGYKIKGVDSNKCIHSSSDGRFNHYDCGSYGDQRFKLESVDGKYKYKIYGLDSQKCMFSNKDGRFSHEKCAPYDDQQFHIVPAEYDCCLANVERKGANTTIHSNLLKCDPKHTDPGGTDCINIYANYCKVGDRMITDPKCKALESSSFTLFNDLMKEKCNLDEFYQTTSCIDWCKNNSTQCNKLNTLQSCKEFGISINDCTPQKVLDVKTDCQKYGIRSEQGLAVSQCSLASIKSLTDQCKEYGILDSCSPGAIQDAIDNATQTAQLEMTAQTQEQIQKNYDTTQKTIADILNLTEPIAEPTATTFNSSNQEFDRQQGTFDINNIPQWIKIQQWIKDNSTTAIIIVVIIFLICSISSSSLLVLSRK